MKLRSGKAYGGTSTNYPKGKYTGYNYLGSAAAIAGGMAYNYAKQKLLGYHPTRVGTKMKGPGAPALSIVVNKKKRGANKKSRATSGRFVGKFKRPRAAAMNKQSLVKYASTGAVSVQETKGKVEDPDCVYLYAHTYAPEEMMVTICRALARKVCEKAFKITYTNFSNLVLAGDASPTTGLYFWALNYVDVASGVKSAQAGAIAGSTTLNTVATEFLPYLKGYSAGYGTLNNANLNEPFTVTVYKQLSSNTDSIVLCTLNLQDEYIDMNTRLEFKIQNRSVSASGSSSTDVVDSNPVQGYIYEFSGLPKNRDMADVSTQGTSGNSTGYKFSSIQSSNGLNIFRAQDTFSDSYREPITAKMFTNCRGVSRVRLQPGDIKHVFRTYQKSCNFVRFLQEYNYQSSNTSGVTRTNKCLGSGILFAFEDVINVNSESEINMTYECEHRMAAKLKTRKNHVIANTYKSVDYSAD